MSVAVSMGQSERVARYEVPDDEQPIGSTLGDPKAVCILKASGAIQKVYSLQVEPKGCSLLELTQEV